jgi:hypothetical protein
MWVETVPAILAEDVPAGAPCSFLGKYGAYAAFFDQCQSGNQAAGALRLPWDRPHGSFFWKYYFEGKHAGDMTGVQAWKKFVPFRTDLPCTTVTNNAEMRFAFELFYAPQGVVVVARATYRGAPKSALQIAALAQAARHDDRFLVGGDTQPAAGLSLDQAAERALALGRQRCLGDAEGYSGDNQPFSITTFLVGENVNPVTQGSDEHFLLETVTGWNRHLQTADLAGLPLAEARLPIRAPDAESLMYARKRGRAVWFPRAFAGAPATPMLACYHRNITQASVQTLSLGEFVSWVAAQHEESTAVAPAVDERAKRAASLLQLLADGKTASGKKVTYRTASVAAQIKDAGWTKAVDLVKALP